MGCNAWNHPADCNCGWGGDTGGGGGYSVARSPGSNLQALGQDFMNPNARCPVCSAPVYFYQSSNGGRVYFDELGPPWPKHPCMAAQAAAKISSFTDLLRFTGTELAPEKAMRMAADLVRHAMRDFREPSRTWPSEELTAARHELLDWMFRRHTTGEEHLVPLADFLLIIGFVEESAQRTVSSVNLHLPFLDEEKQAVLVRKAQKSEATLEIMATVRGHYDPGKEHAQSDQSPAGEMLGDNVVPIGSRVDKNR